MTTQYRLIHYIPDPFTGDRVTLGAMVRTESGVRVEVASRIPGAACLGSLQAQMQVACAVEQLRFLSDFERLPFKMGPHFVLEPVCEIAMSEKQTLQWLRESLLPRPLELAERESSPARAPRRATRGRSYLKQFNADHYVRRFQPSRDLGDLAELGSTLPSISQSVRGSGELLLLEPILPMRAHLERDLRQVATGFWAYRGFFEKHPMPNSVRHYAYMLPGGDEATRAFAMEQLRDASDAVYDMTSMNQRGDFIDQIREIGESGAEQPSL